MALLENGYRKTWFSGHFLVVLNWAKRLKNHWMRSWHTPSPNAYWLAYCNRPRNLVRSKIWSCACIFSTTLLLPSTATHAGWNSKCRCHQQKNTKDLALCKGNTGWQTLDKVYSQKGLTASPLHSCVPASQEVHHLLHEYDFENSGWLPHFQ